MENKYYWLIGIGVLVVILFTSGVFNGGTFAISGSETMTRTSSTSTVNPSGTFQLSYTALGTSGSWGASVVDSITGGCTISGKTSLNIVMVSDLPNPLTYTVQAPSSGSCTFTGNYQFGNLAIVNLPNLIVNICSDTCSSKSFTCGTQTICGTSVNCGTCNSGQQCQIGICKTCNGAADTDCNGIVSRAELGVIITNWVNNQASRSDLGNAITSWSSS